MALAAPSSYTTPSYDEQIVPALRKRLEAESQLLSKRLSYHSGFSDNENELPAAPSKPARTRARVASPELVDRPSAIPRPSFQMNHSASSADLPTTSASRGAKNGSSSAKPPTRAPRNRNRTTSNPFPFDAPASSSTTPVTPQLPSTLPTPASSRSTSPLVATSTSPASTSGTSRPSGIPVPRASAATRIARTRTPTADDALGPMRYPPSPEPSPDLQFSAQNAEPLRAIPAPFSLQGGSDSEAGGRSSVERQRGEREGKEYEFWYRGDKARNGGRGEVHRVGTAEMLEIAAFGHRMRDERAAHSSRRESGIPIKAKEGGSWGRAKGRTVPLLEHELDDGEEAEAQDWVDEFYAPLDEQSIVRERPLTWMEADDASVIDQRVSGERKREADGEWEEARENGEHEQNVSTPVEVPPPMSYRPRGTPKTQLSQSAPAGINPTTRAATTTPATPRARVSSSSKPNGTARTPRGGAPATRQRTPSRPAKPSVNGTLPPKPTTTTTSTPIPRSVSTPAHLQHAHRDSTASISLVDAIPDVPTRRMERGKEGNWDEVVLPTVARRLGLDNGGEEETGNMSEFGERKEDEKWAPPAPGTFAYDASKYRSPSTQTATTTISQYPPPPRQPSPAPFSAYSPVPPERTSTSSAPFPPQFPTAQEHASRPQPPLEKSQTAIERGQQMRGKKPPKIVVSGPAPGQRSVFDVQDEDEGKHGSGCKCVIM